MRLVQPTTVRHMIDVCDMHAECFDEDISTSYIELISRGRTFVLYSLPSLPVAYVHLDALSEAIYYVRTLAVVPWCRRRGHASRLLRFAAALAAAESDGDEAAQLSLHVRAGNRPARRLYAALGFVEVERVRGHYADGEAGVHCVLPLGSGGPADPTADGAAPDAERWSFKTLWGGP